MQSQQAGKGAVNVLQWVTWADQDYVAARALLLSGLLVQGSAFSNTAIEKYFKGYVSGQRLPR